MQVAVHYGEKGYTQGRWKQPYSLKVEVREQTFGPRPEGAAFPEKSDEVSFTYYFNPAYHLDAGGVFPDGFLVMSVEEAEELAHLLIYSIQQARLTKAPVKCELPGELPWGAVKPKRHRTPTA